MANHSRVRRLPAVVLALSLLLGGGVTAARASASTHTAGTWKTYTFGSGITANPYIVYTPRGWAPTKHWPLLVMLHGCETTAYEQMKANLYNPLADRDHFVVAYPDVNTVEAHQPGPTSRKRSPLW